MGKAARFLLLLSGRFVGLLNQFSGAAAAYSLRSLSASTTNVVKVRRSGDDAELDFTATEVSDGTLASWVTAGGGTEDGFVTTWYDQSGNTNNATQATAANQPKIVSSGSLVTENGKAALDFDGTNDGLLNTNATLAALLTDSAFSTFAVLNTDDATSGTDRLVYSVVNTSPSLKIQTIDYRSNEVRGAYYSGSYISEDTPASSDVQYLTSMIYDGASTVALRQNNVDGVSGSSPSAAANTGLSIGFSTNNTFHFNGQIQELILYPSDKSANRTDIEGNINDYYNIYP